MNILYQVKTPYNEIKVVEEYPVRTLLFGEGMCREQSAIDLEHPHNHVFAYSLMSMHSILFVQEPKSILVVGLGGGVIPSQMNHYFYPADIDVLEIDPQVLNIAKTYFSFQENDKVRVHIGDAFDTIDKLDKKYDIVVLDAFTTNYIPFHLMSVEFLRKISSRLNDGGVVAVNVCNLHASYYSHLKTIKEAIGSNIYYLDGFENVFAGMIFATKEEIKPCDIKHLNCHFLATVPRKIHITSDIENSKIFSIKR